MDAQQLQRLKNELATKAKMGIDFILAATIIWSLITLLWALTDFTLFRKSVFTFYIGALMFPLAWLLSKILKTQWTVKTNPLQPLGIWLNVAQLFYFPFLFYFLSERPDYFVMGYAIITGAHFFPYAWFYNEKGYAITAGLISFGTFILAKNLDVTQMYLIPLFMVVCLCLLVGRLVYKLCKMSSASSLKQAV